MANANSRPTFRSAPTKLTWWPHHVVGSPNGMITIAEIAAKTEMTGASWNRILLAFAGMKSSLEISLMTSASGCREPSGPARLGP